MINFPFLLVSLTLFFVWSLLFFFGKKTRGEQIIMSIVGVVLTPAIIMVSSFDYRGGGWLDGFIGLEDLLFAFSLTGVAAVIYEILVGRRLVPLRRKRLGGEHPLHWLATLIIILASWAGIFMALLILFPTNSVNAFAVSGLIIFTYIIADRHDLLLDAILSGIYVMALVFVLEQIFFFHLYPTSANQLWQTGHLSGLFLNQIPLEELLWLMVVGLTIGPIYEYIRHYRVVS